MIYRTEKQKEELKKLCNEMESCNHDRIYFIGSMMLDDYLRKAKPKMYEKFRHLDLYNCCNCGTTLTIDRRDIAELEKKVIEVRK